MSFIKSSCVPSVHTNIEKSSIMTNIWQNNLKKKNGFRVLALPVINTASCCYQKKIVVPANNSTYVVRLLWLFWS